MKQVFLLMAFASLLFSCSKDENIAMDEPVYFDVQAYYKVKTNQQDPFPDVGAKIYVYYGIDERDVILFDYSEGVFSKDAIKIFPEQTAVIDRNGHALLSPKYEDRKVMILAESNYYKNHLLEVSYPSSSEKIVQVNIFGLEPFKKEE